MSGSHAGCTVQEEWLWAPAATHAQLLQGTVAAKTGAWQRVAQHWSQSAPVVLSRGFRGEMPPCSPAQSVTAAVASVVMAQHNQTGHTSQTRSGIGTHQTLLSFCSSSSGRAAEWELGVHHGWKDLSVSSHQTTPTAHSQRARHRDSEGVTNPLPVTDTAAYVGSLAKTSVPQGCSHRTTRWPNADQDPPVLEELS